MVSPRPVALRRLSAARMAIAAARERLHDHVVGRLVAIRAVLAEARDGAPDQLGILAAQLVGAQPEAGEHARPVVLDHHVAGGREPPHQLDAFRGLEVDHDAALVAVERDEIDAVGTDEMRLHGARQIALRRLQLDDLGAEIAQHLRAIRPRQDLRHVEDEQALQERAQAGHEFSLLESKAWRGPADSGRRNRRRTCRSGPRTPHPARRSGAAA